MDDSQIVRIRGVALARSGEVIIIIIINFI